MKKLILVTAASLLVSSAYARDVFVKPHVRQDGTFVEGHYRSSPDSNPYNNYSTQGNVNPYIGQSGTVNPYQQYQPTQIQPLYPSNRGQSGICPYGQRC